MHVLKGNFVAATVIILSCLRHDNPFDITSPSYDPPVVFISSDTLQNGDSTALDSFTVTLSGNRPEVTVRWRLDSLQWSAWRNQGTVSIDGYDTGRHVITFHGWYGEGGEIDSASLAFVKIRIPTLSTDTISLLDDSLVTITAGDLCTLALHAEGNGKIAFYWYRDTLMLDSVSGNKFVVGPFTEKDTGIYYVVARNRWGADTSDTVFLRYVIPVNHPPVAARDSFTVAEDGTLDVSSLWSILKNDTDIDSDTLAAIISDSTRNGELIFNESGTFSYKPDKNFWGADSFTYMARDKKGVLSSAVTVRLTVNAVNDGPEVANNDIVTLDEGQRVTIASSALSVTDIDNSASEIIYTPARLPSTGYLLRNDTVVPVSGMFTQKNIDDGDVAYRHDGGETTADTVIFSVRDGSGGRLDTILLLFYITPVNDTPYFATKLDLAVTEGGLKTISIATLQVKDNDNSPAELVFTLSSITEHGSILKNGTALDAGATFTQYDIDGGRIIYQHDKSNTTRDSLSFTVSDGSGGSIALTRLIIRIGVIDDPPAAIDQSVSTNEDTPLDITLAATDPEGVTIIGWEISRQPLHGTISGSGATRTYIPEQDFSGTDTFMFRGNEGVNWSNTGFVLITVLPENDAPVWQKSSVELAGKEGATITLDLSTVFEKDPEGDRVTFSQKSGVGTISATVWSWTPGFSAAAASPEGCVITATDNGSPVKSADITLNIIVSDSLCKLTTTVTIGTGTIQVQPSGTYFDPGTEVQVSAKPGTDYMFKNWSGDVAETSRSDVTTTVTMNGSKGVSATFVKTVETVMLDNDEYNIHGLIYAEGYYFASTKSAPAKCIRFNANNLAEKSVITFSYQHDNASQLVYIPDKNKIYISFGNVNRPLTIAEVDPFTMHYNEDFIVDTADTTVGNGTLATDGRFLYKVAVNGDLYTKIIKYSIGDTWTRVASLQIDSSHREGHASIYRDSILYITGERPDPWIMKIRTTDLTIIQNHTFTCPLFTDDIGLTGNNLFIGPEANYDDPFSGAIFRVSTNELWQNHQINTGVKGGPASGDGRCYGVQYLQGYIWAFFATTPGIITRIDPISLQYINYQLDYANPNEIASDGKRFFITYWDQDPGVVQAFDPAYLNGREIP